MTVFNLSRLTHDGSIVQRCASNIALAFAVLTRPARANTPPLWLPTALQWASGAAIAVVTFVVLAFAIDAPVIRAVGHLPVWLISFFDYITDYGKSGWLLWPLGILFLAIAARPLRLTRTSQAVLAAINVRIGFLFATIAVPGIVTNLIKHVLGRARPRVGGSIDPFLFSPFNWSAAYASLPSGHATTVFSVMVGFGALWPRLTPALWIYAILIVLSRWIVTAHYPTDTIVAAIIGAGGAYLVRYYFAARGLGFFIMPDGTVRKLPGPSLRRIKSVARELLSQ